MLSEGVKERGTLTQTADWVGVMTADRGKGERDGGGWVTMEDIST